MRSSYTDWCGITALLVLSPVPFMTQSKSLNFSDSPCIQVVCPTQVYFLAWTFTKNVASMCFLPFWDAGRMWDAFNVLSAFSFCNDALVLMWLQKYLSQLAEESLKMKEEGSLLPQDDTGIVPHFAKKKLWCGWTGRAINEWMLILYFFLFLWYNRQFALYRGGEIKSMEHASMPRVPLKTKMPETVSHGEAMLAYL